jgi:alkaline phosphatase D
VPELGGRLLPGPPRRAELDLDFVLHLGDYIYEYGIENGKGPRQPDLPADFAVETTTLEHYRLRHALYKTDPQLRAAHLGIPSW